MRIISGKAGGTQLTVPPGRVIRPTSDRVKEALFSALGDLRGWTVVDLFAGTGALGLEALSRGAETVIFVDNAPRAGRCIEQNLERVRRTLGAETTATVEILRTDVARVTARLPRYAGRLDLVLADPPYRPEPGAFGAAALLLDRNFAAWAAGALLVLEHETDTPLPWAPRSAWTCLELRRYGSRSIAFARTSD